MRNITFVGRIAKALSASSLVSDRVGCESSIMDGESSSVLHVLCVSGVQGVSFSDFRKTLSALSEHSVQRWRDHVVSRALSDYWGSINVTQDHSGTMSPPQRISKLSDAPRLTQQQILDRPVRS